MCPNAGLPARTTALPRGCLLSSRSRVRILPGALNCGFTYRNAAGRGFCGLLPLLRQLLIGLDPISSGSAALGCANTDADSLATLATALRQQITGDGIADGPRMASGSPTWWCSSRPPGGKFGGSGQDAGEHAVDDHGVRWLAGQYRRQVVGQAYVQPGAGHQQALDHGIGPLRHGLSAPVTAVPAGDHDGASTRAD